MAAFGSRQLKTKTPNKIYHISESYVYRTTNYLFKQFSFVHNLSLTGRTLEITGAANELDPVGPQAFSASSELICYTYFFIDLTHLAIIISVKSVECFSITVNGTGSALELGQNGYNSVHLFLQRPVFCNCL